MILGERVPISNNLFFCQLVHFIAIAQWAIHYDQYNKVHLERNNKNYVQIKRKRLILHQHPRVICRSSSKHVSVHVSFNFEAEISAVSSLCRRDDSDIASPSNFSLRQTICTDWIPYHHKSNWLAGFFDHRRHLYRRSSIQPDMDFCRTAMRTPTLLIVPQIDIGFQRSIFPPIRETLLRFNNRFEIKLHTPWKISGQTADLRVHHQTAVIKHMWKSSTQLRLQFEALLFISNPRLKIKKFRHCSDLNENTTKRSPSRSTISPKRSLIRKRNIYNNQKTKAIKISSLWKI